MKCVAKFEKVSKEQYKKDWGASANQIKNDNPDLALNWCYDSLQLPVRKTKGSAGYDFITPCDLVLRPRSDTLIITGIKCKIDDGYVLKLYPRSSLGFKFRMSLDNTVGIIDSDYYNNQKNEGHILIKVHNPSNRIIEIKAGEAYAQGIFSEFFTAEEAEVTTERVGGIGSTNK